jgi:hypothetical protein
MSQETFTIIELVLFFGGVMLFCLGVLAHQFWEERRDAQRRPPPAPSAPSPPSATSASDDAAANDNPQPPEGI